MNARRARIYWWKAQDTYHEYPRAFWVLMAGTFIDRLGTNLIMPFLAVYVAQRFNAAMTQIGVIFTIFAISGVGGNLLAGALADRFGRRGVMIIGLVCAATARVVMGMVSDLQTLYIAAVFAGFFGSVGWPAQAAMTADLLREDKRADGFGIQRVVGNLTWVLGPLIGGILAPITGYLLLFVLDALTSYVMAIIVYTKLPETKPEKKTSEPHETLNQTLAGYAYIVRDGLFMAFIGISILMVSAYLQMYATLSVFLVRFRAMPESFYGALLMVNAGMVVLLQFPITRWTSRRAPMLVMIGGSALYLLGLGIYGAVTAAGLYVIAMALISIGEMFVMPTGQALVAQLAPASMRARYVAAHGFTWIIPQALAPLAAGMVMDHADARWVWYGSAIVCAVSMVGFYGLHLRLGGPALAEAEQQVVVPAKAEPAA